MKSILVLCAAITFAVLSGTAAAFAPVGQIGDTNDDDTVDLVDLNNVENNFGENGFGDGDGDNDVDLDDLNNVRNYLGAGEQGSIPPAPVSSDWGIRLSSQLHRAYATDTFQPIPLPDISGPVAVPLTYRIDLFLEFQSRAVDQVGFGAVMFDIALNGLTTSTALSNWQGDNTAFGPPLKLKWGHNSDFGNVNDLKNIVMGLQPKYFGAQGSDPRWTIGQNGPEFLGSLFVDWDGQSQRKLEFTVAQHSYYDANRQLHLSGEGVQNASILFGEQLQVVPEPASIAVWACLGLTAAGIQWRRRGQNSKSAG